MSNEELAHMIQAGDQERLTELLEQVRRLVLKQARRWATGGSGADMEYLLQAGAIAVIRAVDSFDSARGTMFSTYLFSYLKQEFSLATGRQSKRSRMDPLQSAVSLDAPLTDDEGEPLTLADLLPDPAAESAMLEVDERDRLDHLRAAVEAAIATLTPEQQAAIRRRYYDQAPPLPPGPERQRDNIAHAAAMRMLRHPSRSRELLAFW